MAIITKATPRPYQDGIRDASGRIVPLEQEQIPQHLPLFIVQSAKGEDKTKFQSGASLLETLGDETFNEAGKFYSHQVAGLQLAAQHQIVGVRRVVSDNTKKAGFCLAVEYYKDTVKLKHRNADGVFLEDVNSDPLDSGAGSEITAIKRRLVLLDGITAANYKTQVETAGTIDTKTTKIVPLIAGICEYGEYGNNTGFRIEPAHLKSANPADGSVAAEQNVFLYRWSWQERKDAKSSSNVRLSLLQEREIDFSFKKGAKNTRTNASYDKQRIFNNYQRKGSGQVEVEGPVKDLFFYEENIVALLDEMMKAEEAAVEARSELSAYKSIHEFNLLSDVDFKGRQYDAIITVPGGISADAHTTHFCKGGSDGTVSEAELSDKVGEFLDGDWTNPLEPLDDSAQYPFSQLYDTGFPLDTKKSFLRAVGKRHNVKVDVCTQDLSGKENTIADELAVGKTLRAFALMMPESVIHGTQTCRASIWGSMGTYTPSLFGLRLPAIFDIIQKRSRYMGAGNGRMNSRWNFTNRSLNSVEILTDLTHTYQSFGIKDQYWDLGINYVQYRDRTDVFWPAYQTIYSDDTSALNSDVVVSILTNIKRQADYHWAINTNTIGLTDEEFIERSDADFFALIDGRYDGLVDIEFETRMTPSDNARGYSWTLDINVSSGPMRTVGQYNITVVRPE